jgi:hypothetical protein
MSKRRRTVRASVRSAFRSSIWGLLALLVLCAAGTARAHIPVLQGRLIDLIRRSDVIVLGTADQLQPVGARRVDVALTVDDVIVGSISEHTLIFRAPSGIAAGERYVVFLRRTGSSFESIQPSGTVFPSRPENDADYRRAITSISQALHRDPAQQVDAVRAALIATLSASPPPLRYHAALELSALTRDGHVPTEVERRHLAALLASPALDPALRPLLISLSAPP